MWGKNHSNRPEQISQGGNQDYSQDYAQNYAANNNQESNPFNRDSNISTNKSVGQPANHFDASEGRDDARSQYSSNTNPTYNRIRDPLPEAARFGSDYGTRSGTSISNRHGQTGGSPFSTQYGLNYGPSKERSDYGAEHFNLDEAPVRGAHFGKGPKNYRRPDERIHEEANERLMHDQHIDATELEVSVSEGVITLSGTVEERRMKRMAEDCVESISGVQDVRNEILVQSNSSAYASKDSKLM